MAVYEQENTNTHKIVQCWGTPGADLGSSLFAIWNLELFVNQYCHTNIYTVKHTDPSVC